MRGGEKEEKTDQNRTARKPIEMTERTTKKKNKKGDASATIVFLEGKCP